MSEEFWFEEGCFILELSNSPEDEACSIARTRVPAGGTTRWHRLDGIAERYVILEGRGRAEVGDAAPRDVEPGDVVRIAPGERQRIASLGPEELVFLAICTPRFRREGYQALEG